MRIGYLLPEFPRQTHTFWWRELAVLARMGVEADVVSTRRPPASLMSHAWSAEAMGRTTYLFPPGAGMLGAMFVGLLRAGPLGLARALAAAWRCERRARPLMLIPFAAGVLQRARSRGWRHAHAHSAGDCAHVAMLCERLGGPPYSVTLHGPLRDYGPNQREKWCHAAFGIVITGRLLGEANSELGDVLPERIEVAPMGVDVGRFTRPEAYRAWDGVGIARLYCCARLNRAKGHAELIAAVGRLRAEGVAVELTIAGQDDSGGGGYRLELERLVRELGLESAVKMPGAVDEGDVARGLWGAHVFVLASHHEPLGVAIMEAMAAGVPVVVTRGGGVTELVTEGVDGVLVEPRDVEGLAGGIRRVLEDAGLAERLGAAGVETVARGFHSGVSARVLVDLIEGRSVRSREPDLGVAR